MHFREPHHTPSLKHVSMFANNKLKQCTFQPTNGYILHTLITDFIKQYPRLTTTEIENLNLLVDYLKQNDFIPKHMLGKLFQTYYCPSLIKWLKSQCNVYNLFLPSQVETQEFRAIQI
jgi:hypothetical protein